MRTLWLLLLVGCSSASGAPKGSGVGKACATDADCSTGYCITAPAYPGGYCSVKGCKPGSCPSDSDCTGGGKIGSVACFLRCKSNSDCRAGYHCCPDKNKVKVCAPPGTGLSC